MYWLRWHYHVKDIAGAPNKIKKERKKRKEKQNNRIADSLCDRSVEADMYKINKKRETEIN